VQVVAVASFQLCQSDHSGRQELYACQNFATAADLYRVFFRGGRQPKAIATVTKKGEVDKMLWSATNELEQPVCHFPSPPEIPAAASFQGAGVCTNEDEKAIPCAVFRHKALRLSRISEYLVYYKTDGAGPQSTSVVDIGANHDAAPAELAYRIGLSLLETRCCRQRGLRYIQYASQLFPGSTLYRNTYQHYAKQRLAHEGDL
jgi:hypothetical protein